MTDPISDMLCRIRNALLIGRRTVDVPASNIKVEMLKKFQEGGFIRKFVVVDDGKQGVIKILLRYKGSLPVIQGLRRVSSPGRRLFFPAQKIPRVLSGLGISLVSTSQGIVTDTEARTRNVGGEVLCKIW